MARYLFNPTTHYNQTEGGGAISSVINSTEVDITNVPSIDLGFIRKNTTDVPNGVAGLDGDAKLIANLDWNKINSGKPTTLGGYGIGDGVNVADINAANGVAGLDANAKLNVNLDWNKVTTGKPTTLDGYGIGDGINVADINAANGVAGLDANAKLNVDMDWNHVTTGKPTTLGGYGINDAVNVSAVNAANGVAGLDANAKLNVNMDWSKVTTGKPTTLTGYGINDAVGLSLINAANGVAGLDSNGKLGNTVLPVGTGTTITGPVTVTVNQVAEYKIVPYSTFNNYTVSVVGGSFTQLDDTITFTVTGSIGSTASITVNGATYPITISAAGINTPSIITPTAGDTNVSLTPTFNSSQFSYTGTSQSLNSATWELATNDSFTTGLQTYTPTSNFTTWSPSIDLVAGTIYYVHVKYRSNLGIWSAYSPTITFTAISATSSVVAPTITSPTTTTNVSLTPTFTTSRFAYLGDYQIQTRVNWELATSNSFGGTVVQSYEGVNNPESWSPSTALSFNTSYYVRVKHFSAVGGWSEWSPVFTFLTVAGTGITGSTTVYTNDIARFDIVDYVSNGVYTVSAVGGTVERVNGIVSFTVTASAGGTASITFNGQLYPLTVVASGVSTPSITSHANDAPNVPLVPSFASSPFIKIGAEQTHTSTRWELATDNVFGTVVDYYEGPILRSWTPNTLLVNTSYYLRVKYRSNIDAWSEWSATVRFSTVIDSSITGRNTVHTGEVVPYTISNYSSSVTYNIISVGGTNTTPNSSGVFTFTVTASAGGVASITINNGTPFTLTVEASSITTPSIDSHSNPATNVSLTPNFTSTAFVPNGAQQSHDKTRWELATTSSFGGTVVQFSEDSSHLRAWTPTILAFNTDYYLRVRYHSVVSDWSEWSNVVSLHTLAGTAMTGPTTVYTSAMSVFTFTGGRISGANYIITPVGGTIIPTQDGFVFTTTASAGSPASITLNGQLYPLTVEASRPNAPNITAPTAGDTGVSLTPNFAGSQPTFVGASQSHDNTEWQLATNDSFTTGLQTYIANSNSTTWTPTSLTQNTLYYAHVKYHSAVGGWSEWSTSISFTTIVVNSSITGQGTVYAGETYPYNIVGYSGSNTYVVTCQGGTVSQTNGVITFIVSPTATAPVSITVNGNTTTLILGTSTITTPTVTPLANGGTNVSLTPTFTSSTFVPTGATQSQDSAEWQLDIDANFNPASQAYTATSNFTTWAPTTLTVDTTYYVRVRYHSNKGIFSAWSTPVTFTTLGVEASVMPPIISSPTNNDTGVSLTPSFNSSTPDPRGANNTVTSARWELATNSNFTTPLVNESDGSSNITSWTITASLTNGTDYYVRVMYRGSISGASSWSNTVKFTTLTVAASVGTPIISSPSNNSTGVSLTPQFNSSAPVLTGANNTISTARWELATNSNFTPPLVNVSDGGGNITLWTIGASLTDGTDYYVRVRYTGTAGVTSSWSNTVKFTTLTVAASILPPIISSPTNNDTGVSLTPSFNSSTPVITGTNNTLTSARWELATTDSFGASVVKFSENGSNITTWLPSGSLTNGTDYYVRVRYTGTVSGASSWSGTIKFTTLTIVASVQPPIIQSPVSGTPDVPLNVGFTSSTSVITGTNNTITGARWELATNSNFNTPIDYSDGGINVTTWTPTVTLTSATTYYVRVRYTGSVSGPSSWSSTTSFTTVTAVSITGLTTGYSGQQLTYTITNYNASTTYTIVSVGGTNTTPNSSGVFTFTVNNAFSGQASITVNGTVFNITITATVVNKPSITYPLSNDTNIGLLPTFNSSPFVSNNTELTHTKSSWSVRKSTNGSLPFETTTSLRSITPISSLLENTLYYVKVRYQGQYGDWSEWSDEVGFTTTLNPGWVARLDGRLTYEAFYDSAIDTSGNTYTVGRDSKTTTGGYIADCALIAKWSPTGALLWKFRLASTTENSIFMGVTVDSSNNIYAVGAVNTGYGLTGEGLITKWDSNGTLAWQKSVTAVDSEVYNAVTCDTAGNVYAVGYANANQTTPSRPFITKLNASGILSWHKLIFWGGTDAAFYGATCDSSNNLIVVGRFGGNAVNLVIGFAVLLKIETNAGGLLWSHVKGISGFSTSFNNVTIDASNNIYAAGWTYAFNTVNGCSLSKFDSAGIEQWQKQLVGTINGGNNDSFFDLDCDASNNIYAVGRIYNSGNNLNGIITKWDDLGGLTWQRSITTSINDELYSINLNGTDYLNCAGYVATPDSGYAQTVIKITNNVSTIPNGVLTGTGMTHISITTPTLNKADNNIPTVTDQTIVLSPVAYTMTDKTLTKTDSDFTSMLSNL